MAKGHEPAIEAVTLSAAEHVDGLVLPKGTTLEREARWDEARDEYGPKQLARFTLSAAINACGIQLPAHIPIDVRRGMPVFSYANTSEGTSVHLVWRVPRAQVVDGRAIPADSLLGIECASRKITLVVESKPFDVDHVRVTSAAWYPSEQGGGPLLLQLAAAADIVGVHVPAGFTVTFAPNGHLFSLLGPSNIGVQVGDHVCWTSTQADQIRFDDKARATCTEVVAGGVLCDGHLPIVLHGGADGGHLASCTLASSFHHGDRAWPVGTQLWLAPDGQPLP
ncbi:MAG: hypothetical protein ABI591_18210 [Kofleriaceae bacterium]